MLKGLPEIKDVGLIVVSPMRRTLQTAQEALGWLIDKGVPVIVNADWTETSMNACDIGSDVNMLIEEFPRFKFDEMHPEWPQKTGRFAHDPNAVNVRGEDCRQWLRERPEKVVVAVSHADFLFHGICQSVFQNAEYRIFDFADEGIQLKERFGVRVGAERYRRASFS